MLADEDASGVIDSKKRAHLTSACGNCRKAHHSCDIERPCRRCVVKGLEESCQPEAQRKRGRKGKLRCGDLKNIDFSIFFKEKKNGSVIVGKNRSESGGKVKEESDEEKSGESSGNDSNFSYESEESPVQNVVYSNEISAIRSSEDLNLAAFGGRGQVQVHRAWGDQRSVALIRRRREETVQEQHVAKKQREIDEISNFDDIVSNYLVSNSDNLFSWMFSEPPRSPVPANEDDIERVTKAMSGFKITMEERSEAYRNVRVGLVVSGLTLPDLKEVMYIVTNITNQHNRLYYSLTPYQRLAVEEEFQEILRGCISYADNCSAATCVWDAFGWVRYVNPAMRSLNQFPGEIPYADHNLLFILYDFQMQSFVDINKAWSLSKEVSLPLIVPVSLQVWGYHPNWILRSKTGIDGNIEQFLDGTLIMDPKVNALGFPVIFTLTFIPSPSLLINGNYGSP